MDFLDTILIAIVEGLTEFLPVSSTGHMIIAQKVLGIESTEFVKAFTVNIQFGAILSVVVLYWQRFFRLRSREECLAVCPDAGPWKVFLFRFDFYVKLFVALIPAAVLGLVFSDMIDSMLESVLVVSIMLVLGGIFMLKAENIFNKQDSNQDVSSKKAFNIGLCQCIAMIPGVSRSMATIVGGMAQRLSRKNAAEFSFFLAVPTMLAASGYKLLQNWDVLFETGNLSTLLLGNIVSFIVAMAAIKWFIGFVTKYGFKGFGWYRILVGGILLVLIFSGVELSIL